MDELLGCRWCRNQAIDNRRKGDGHTAGDCLFRPPLPLMPLALLVEPTVKVLNTRVGGAVGGVVMWTVCIFAIICALYAFGAFTTFFSA